MRGGTISDRLARRRSGDYYMQVAASSVGRFHTFELARQLLDHSSLAHLWTGYPASKVHELPIRMVSCRPFLVAPWMAAGQRLPPSAAGLLHWALMHDFDHWVARSLRPADVFVALSGMATVSQGRAKMLGARIVCDRGSTHILHQQKVLRAEYKRWGMVSDPFRYKDWLVRRELAEYQLADLITVPSKQAASTFVTYGVPKEKLRVIPYGVDLRMFRPIEARTHPFRAAFVGTLSILKGIPHLLRAGGHLPMEIQIWLVGPLSPEIRPFVARATQREPGRWRIFGHVPRSRLAALFSQVDALILPSIDEGFGLVLAQAMACGVPVIATENTGARDLFENGVEGMVIPGSDAAAIAAALTWLYEHPARRREMAAAAKRRMETVGGWRRYGDIAVETYEQLLK